MSEKKNGCICQGSTNLIFSCSGAADVGGLSDQAARKMTKDGIGKIISIFQRFSKSQLT